jgi:hypothetical protein
VSSVLWPVTSQTDHGEEARTAERVQSTSVLSPHETLHVLRQAGARPACGTCDQALPGPENISSTSFRAHARRRPAGAWKGRHAGCEVPGSIIGGHDAWVRNPCLSAGKGGTCKPVRIVCLVVSGCHDSVNRKTSVDPSETLTFLSIDPLSLVPN